MENLLKKAKETLSAREKDLVYRAERCLKENFIAGTKDLFSGRNIVIPSKTAYLGVWNWDSAFIALGLSYWDINAALDQVRVFFDNQTETGMFVDALLLDGEIYQTTTKPPVFAWVLKLIDERYGLPDLNYYYEKLKKNEKWWRYHRMAGDLFHYDSFILNDHYKQSCRNESGWDTSVRWDNGAETLWAVDLNCYMLEVYRSLLYFSVKLQKFDDYGMWKSRAEKLEQKIEEIFWCEKAGFYCDYNFETETHSKVFSPAGFMPLFVKTASKERAKLCAEKAMSEKYFYPYMPTVAYCDEKYTSFDYWRGPTWLNVFYFAIAGLENCGFHAESKKLRENFLQLADNEKSGIYEYYDSRTGKGLGAFQFSWSAAFILELILNEK